MKRFISLVLVFVFLVCTMIPCVASATTADPLTAEWFSQKYKVVYSTPSFAQQNNSRLTYVAEGDLGPKETLFFGPYTLDTISMSVAYTPTSEQIAYGVTTNPNTLSNLDFRVATGGSGSATLRPGYRTYYVMVANKSNTTMHFTLTYTPTATMK